MKSEVALLVKNSPANARDAPSMSSHRLALVCSSTKGNSSIKMLKVVTESQILHHTLLLPNLPTCCG
ncbi:hypothetical protein CapIbe_000506 [Capra ibex]